MLTNAKLQQLMDSIADAAQDNAGKLTTVQPRMWVSNFQRVPYGAQSGALDANDAIGDKLFFRFDVDGVPLPVKGRLIKVQVIDQADQLAGGTTLEFFNDDFTAAAADAAFTISASDAQKHVAHVPVSPLVDLGSGRVFSVTDLDEDYYSPTRQLVVQGWDTGTLTFTAANLPLIRIWVQPVN